MRLYGEDKPGPGMHERECQRYLWGNYTEPSGSFCRGVSFEPRCEIIIMGDKERMSDVGMGPSSIYRLLTDETIAVRCHVLYCSFQTSGEHTGLPKRNVSSCCRLDLVRGTDAADALLLNQ